MVSVPLAWEQEKLLPGASTSGNPREGGVGTSGTFVWEPSKALGSSGQSRLAVGTHGIAESQPASRFYLQIPPGQTEQ